MQAGAWQPTWSVDAPPILSAEIDDEDHKATLKYPAPVVRPPLPSLPRGPRVTSRLVRLLPHSVALGVVLAAGFLFLFGDELVPNETALRAASAGARLEAASPGVAPPEAAASAVPPASPSSDPEPQLDPCASPKVAGWPEGLCAWVVARARGEELVPGPSQRDVQAFLFHQRLAKVRGRVTSEPDEHGLRQAVVQGVWGHCVVLAAPPADDGSFFTWMRRRTEPASIPVAGRPQTCVALDEDPVGAVGELVYLRPGSESADVAKRILSVL